jgi:uncharacterized membrane protein (UPF0127 family)
MSAAPARLVDADSGAEVAARLEIASSSWSRFMGLMGRDSIEPGGGLLLEPCNSIHMFFMRFAIDVLFLDRRGRVKKVMLNLKPWRISPIVFGARSVVELPSGTLADRGLVGRTLRVDTRPPTSP